MSHTISQPSAGGEEREARNRLVEQHLFLVNFFANRFKGVYLSGLEVKDLIQEGYLGLIRAAELYDPEKINPETGRPYHFSSYAGSAIRGNMLNALGGKAHPISLPGQIWLDLIHLKRLQDDFWLHEQREPCLDELAGTLQRTPQQVLRLLEIREVKSLDAPLSFAASDDEVKTLGDLLEAPIEAKV